MARKYLTPIDLTGLELQNAKIQNLATNPSAYGKGHVYFNTAHNELRVYDGTMWVAVGGSLEFGNTASRPAAGNAGRSYADTQTGTLYVDNGTAWVQIGVNAGDLASAISSAALGSTDDLSEGTNHLYFTTARARESVSGTGYISYNSSTGVFSLNYSALKSDLEDDLVADGFVTTTGTQTLTNKTIGDNLHFYTGATNAGYISPDSGTLTINANNALALEADGDITLTSTNGDLVISTDGYAYLGSKTQNNKIATLGDITTINNIAQTITTGSTYISDVDGIIDVNITALESKLVTDGFATTTDISNALTPYLTSTDAASTYQTQNGLDSAVGGLGYIKSGDQYIQSVDTNVFNVSGSELLLNNGIQQSIVTASGYNINSGGSITAANGIYSGGATPETDGSLNIQDSSGNNLVVLGGSAGAGYIETHGVVNLYRAYGDGGAQYAALNSDASNNFIVNAYDNNLILSADGSVYLGAATSGNEVVSRSATETLTNKTLTTAALGSNLDAGTYKITNLEDPTSAQDAATKSYVDGVAQGLAVMGSVLIATSANIDITANASAPIQGVTLANGDRVLVKSQTTATENGIYVYNSSTQTLVLSTNPSDTIKLGSYTLVTAGTYAAQGWVVTAFAAGASTWTQFSAAGEYTAGYGIDITDGAISVKLDSDSLSESASGLKVNLASNGAIENDGGLFVNVGEGIQINGSNQLAIDDAVVVRKYAATIGDGAATTFTVTHGLGTRDVQVAVYDASTYEEVVVDVTRTSTSAISVDFAVAPSSNAYRVVVQA